MFLLDYFDWDRPINTILSIAFTITFVLFIAAALGSLAILFINALFGYTTYPEETNTHAQHDD